MLSGIPKRGNYSAPTGRIAGQTGPLKTLRQVAQRNAFSHGERDRYDHAIEHLSQFSAKLYSGRFDRGKLDRSIEYVRNVLRTQLGSIPAAVKFLATI